MIVTLLDDQYERIKGDLEREGITCGRLMDDLADHVCCMVEELMGQGEEFESSYSQVMDGIGEGQFRSIQHQTLLNLDKKFQRMKKFTYVFGLSSAAITLIGALFKRWHWPGSAVLIGVGMAMLVLVFLPLYFVTSNRELAEKKNPVYAIMGYLTLALLLAAAAFKNLHWPGASILIYLGPALLILGFLPLYVVNVFQRSGREKVTLPYLVMLVIGITIVVLFSNINTSKELLDIYRESAAANEDRTELLQEKTAMLIERSSDSDQTPDREAISGIHELAVGLQRMIDQMQEEMKVYVNQPGVPIEELKWVDLRGAGRGTTLNDGDVQDFILEARKYKTLLDELVQDPVARNQIEDHLEFTGDVWNSEFGPREMREAPLMKNYYKNTDAAKGIALSEYVAITSLMQKEKGP